MVYPTGFDPGTPGLRSDDFRLPTPLRHRILTPQAKLQAYKENRFRNNNKRVDNCFIFFNQDFGNLTPITESGGSYFEPEIDSFMLICSLNQILSRTFDSEVVICEIKKAN